MPGDELHHASPPAPEPTRRPTQPVYFALICAAAVGIGFGVFELIADLQANTFLPIFLLTVSAAFFAAFWLAHRRRAAWDMDRLQKDWDEHVNR